MTREERTIAYIHMIEERLACVSEFVNKIHVADGLTDIEYELLSAEINLDSIYRILDNMKNDFRGET